MWKNLPLFDTVDGFANGISCLFRVQSPFANVCVKRCSHECFVRTLKTVVVFVETATWSHPIRFECWLFSIFLCTKCILDMKLNAKNFQTNCEKKIRKFLQTKKQNIMISKKCCSKKMCRWVYSMQIPLVLEIILCTTVIFAHSRQYHIEKWLPRFEYPTFCMEWMESNKEQQIPKKTVMQALKVIFINFSCKNKCFSLYFFIKKSKFAIKLSK